MRSNQTKTKYINYNDDDNVLGIIISQNICTVNTHWLHNYKNNNNINRMLIDLKIARTISNQ